MMANYPPYQSLEAIAKLWGPIRSRPVSTSGNSRRPSVWPVVNTVANIRSAVILALVLGSLRPAAADNQQIEAPHVDWSHVLHAHRLAESWVSAGRVPQRDGAEPINVTSLLGVRVVLRWAGRVMGQGHYIAEEPDRAGDLLLAVRAATAEALKGAVAALQSQQTGGRVPQSKHMSLENLAQRLCVDLQAAYRLEPIQLKGLATEHDLLRAFAPGYHGLLAMRRDKTGTQRKAWVWPASALAMNVRPQGQLRRLMVDLAYRHDALQHLDEIDDLSLDRFKVIHYVRPASDLPVTRLVRGNELLPCRAVTGRDIEGATHLMARYLIGRQLEDGSFAGTFIPAAHTFRPATADLGQAGLAIYALARREALDAVEQAGHREDLRRAVRRGALAAANRLTDQTQPMDPAASALLILTLIKARYLADLKPQRDALADRLIKLQNADGSFRSSAAAAAHRVRPSTQGLCAAALACLYDQTRDNSLTGVIHRARNWLWFTTDPSAVAYTLPWSGMAELRMDRVAPADDAEHRRLFDASMQTLLSVKKAILARQVVDAPSMGPADVVGGFDLTGTRAGQAPVPDWRSASLLAFLAAIMRHDPVNDEANVIDDLLACGLAARFVAQLMVDEPDCFFAIDRGMMVGGVRSAFWDNHLPLDRTAMGLLALTELQETLGYLATKRRRAVAIDP